ncbi:MAG: diaminopimelate epimerase [Flavobacteriales bacterium]|nr:diaminopimelate epimerase [Flavobacteriales bacterium]
MQVTFTKYHGTGNDFIMIDNRSGAIQLKENVVQRLCDRHFGVGADGIILIETHSSLDFYMNYYNSDGSQSFCGNGSRCAVHFAKELGIDADLVSFEAIDGEHEARWEDGQVVIKMGDALPPDQLDNHYFIHTGSPHVVKFVPNVAATDVFTEGAQIRNSEDYLDEGTNVNFVERRDDTLLVRTYERGVEDETLSCGTGVTGAAMVDAYLNGGSERFIQTPGGSLHVRFQMQSDGFFKVELKGPATPVFQGILDLKNDSDRR